MVIDADKVWQNKVRAVVEIDWRGTEGEADDLCVDRQLGSARAEAELEGEELGHTAAEAVAEDHQLVVRKLLEFLHKGVHHLIEDFCGSISHSHVSLTIQERAGLAVKVLKYVVDFHLVRNI